ncbi:MAG: ABC transporter ATP-binding protein [Clostridia bacterium]|nr:ABC transporter ATP-binding protein [Clostridia bacterium]
MIILDGISKTYGKGNNITQALKDISLCIEKHSFCSIVGNSGSGKSTLLNIIGCLDFADSGTYFLDNEEIYKTSADRLSTVRNNKIGFVFQNYNLIRNLNVMQNIELPLIISGVERRKRKEMVEKAVDAVGLYHRRFHRPNELSGGQQQKVAVARAIIKNPPLILADEPTGNLDSVSGKEIMDLLAELNKDGATVLMITHDIECAKQTERIIKIKEGKIQ